MPLCPCYLIYLPVLVKSHQCFDEVESESVEK